MKFNIFNIFAKNILIILLIAFSVAQIYAQNANVSTADEIKEDINVVPCKSEERQAGVKKLFIKMGAKENEISTEKFKDGENLVIKKKGNSDETVIIGAHYDKVKEGCGAIDNWTGIVIIANIYKTLSQFPTNKSYVFVAFDKEEAGLLGSKALVSVMPKENFSQICSMVNIDSFGFTAPQSPRNLSNSKMVKLAKDTAKEMQVDFADSAIENADADSSSFLAKKIPAITFDGLSNNWQKFLHTSNDKLENINPASVFVGYRFVLNYVVKIDALGCHDFK
ncbi:MAG: M28 family metallopeptidase [Pyrinomonadaceae bacterium]